MTTAILIEKLREELGTFDVPAEQAVAMAKEILQRAKAAPQPSEDKFISRNITLEEYAALPLEEKSRYHDEAEEINQRWVEAQLKKHSAKWIMVVDDQIVRHGTTMKNFPNHEEIIALCNSTGKYPFVFFSPRIFAIEELATSWHTTKEPNDAYPALSIKLLGNNNHVETEADLDTGAIDCYAPLELLQANGVVKIQSGDVVRFSKHLGQTFFYFALPVWLELAVETGTSRKCVTTVFCVVDWRNSPFAAINPNRTFLLGREVLFELKPRLTLDFAVRCTEVQFPKATS
jgi:hypothetical protein